MIIYLLSIISAITNPRSFIFIIYLQSIYCYYYLSIIIIKIAKKNIATQLDWCLNPIMWLCWPKWGDLTQPGGGGINTPSPIVCVQIVCGMHNGTSHSILDQTSWNFVYGEIHSWRNLVTFFHIFPTSVRHWNLTWRPFPTQKWCVQPLPKRRRWGVFTISVKSDPFLVGLFSMRAP